MSECISCKHVMNDGMCLAMGKFTTLDAPACAEYLPTDQAIIDTLKTENAKLRKLVLCLLTCSSDASDACDKCPVNGGTGIWGFEDFCDSLLDRVHELGIEVDV